MDLELIRGDSQIFTITVRDSNGVVVNLTGAYLWFRAKRKMSDVDEDAVITKTTGAGIVVTNAAGGIATISISTANTDGLMPGSYRYDVQVKDAANEVNTVLRGRLRVLADVNRANT